MTAESRFRSAALAFVLASLGTAATVHAQSNNHYIYVDAAAPAGGNGTSWLRAFRDLQDALALARTLPTNQPGEYIQIRVAQGVYRPDRGTGDRNASFVVFGSGTTLIGGFGGITSGNPNAQSTDFVSVLSGDLRGDDGPDFTNRDDNSYHVVRCQGGEEVSMQGFTIRGGNTGGPVPAANPDGGGVLAAAGAPAMDIFFCRITDNQALGSGGGIAGEDGGQLYIGQCTIDNNAAQTGEGGGLYASVEVNVSGSMFTQNRAAAATGDGGGASLTDGEVSQTQIVGNFSAGSGGGLALHSACTLIGCTIAGNQSQGRGGGLSVSPGGTAPTIQLSFIGHNFAALAGGGLASSGGSPAVVNCTLARNTSAGSGQEVFLDSQASAALTNCIIWDNSSQAVPFWVEPSSTLSVYRSDVQSTLVGGGGAGNWSADNLVAVDPRFVDPVGSSQDPLAWADKDYSLRPDSPCIDAGLDAISRTGTYLSDAGFHAAPINSTCTACAQFDIGGYEFQGSICPPPIPVVYVNAAAAPGRNGLSWATAKPDIQSALKTPGVTQVWIAAGTYTPDGGTHDRSALWRIERPVIELHGGFAGNETSLDQRNIAAHPTILSGDLLGNDTADPASRADNSLALIQADFEGYTFGTLALSGLIIQGAEITAQEDWAPAGALYVQGDLYMTDCTIRDNHVSQAVGVAEYDNGGCVNLLYGLAEITRCTFENNTTIAAGAALHLQSGTNADLTDCVFQNNHSGTSGGAIWMEPESLSISRCTFLGNSVENAAGSVRGGAALIAGNVLIDRCRFVGNSARSSGPSYDAPMAFGGALFNYSGGAIQNSLFTSNQASGSHNAWGSAVYTGESTTIANCTFADNNGSGAAGAVPAALSFDTSTYGCDVANCIFWNTLTPIPATMVGTPGLPFPDFVRTSIVQNATPDAAAGILTDDPRFANPLGPDGILGTVDDDYRLAATSPAIDRADSTALAPSTLFDLAGAFRFVDDPAHPNLGSGPKTYLDLGCYEFDPARCPADFDRSGTVDVADIFAFINAWLALDPLADFNLSGSITPQDIFDFLTSWFAGC